MEIHTYKDPVERYKKRREVAKLCSNIGLGFMIGSMVFGQIWYMSIGAGMYLTGHYVSLSYKKKLKDKLNCEHGELEKKLEE